MMKFCGDYLFIIEIISTKFREKFQLLNPQIRPIEQNWTESILESNQVLKLWTNSTLI